MSHYSSAALFFRKLQYGIGRSPHLEGAHLLEVLTFEIKLSTNHFIDERGGENWRVVNEGANSIVGSNQLISVHANKNTE
ncbi:MAG: hypothetical protein ACI9RU_003165 [Litorivivens sp.]